jgi:hypothetical protein
MRDKPREVMTLAGLKAIQDIGISKPADLAICILKAYFDATDMEIAELDIKKALAMIDPAQLESLKRDMTESLALLKKVAGHSQSSPTAG